MAFSDGIWSSHKEDARAAWRSSSSAWCRWRSDANVAQTRFSIDDGWHAIEFIAWITDLDIEWSPRDTAWSDLVGWHSSVVSNSCPSFDCLAKYFWAWLRICAEVLVGMQVTTFFHSLPNILSPRRKALCSAAVQRPEVEISEHGWPFLRAALRPRLLRWGVLPDSPFVFPCAKEWFDGHTSIGNWTESIEWVLKGGADCSCRQLLLWMGSTPTPTKASMFMSIISASSSEATNDGAIELRYVL